MRNPLVSRLYLAVIVLGLGCAGLALFGCATPPTTMPTTGAGPATAGGTAASDVSKVMTTPATAFAQPGASANSKGVTAAVERQNTNTAAGESVNGVIFPGTAAYMSLVKADPVMAALTTKINETDPTAPEFADLADRFKARSDELREILKGVSPDFGSLQTINVMILICKDVGAAEGETGDKQSEAVANAMAKVVESTMGNE